MSKKIKVLFVTAVYENIDTGPGKFSQILPLVNQGEIVDLYILTPDINIENKKVFKLRYTDPPFLKPISFFYRMYEVSKKVKELSIVQNFDIVWFNNAIEGYMSAKRNKNIVHVGMINDYTSVKCTLKNYGISYKYIRHKIFQKFEKLSFKYYKRIISNSNYLKSVIVDYYHVSNSQITILRKAVNIYPGNLNLEKINVDDPIKILFLKSNFQIGGLKYLVEALSLLTYNFILSIGGTSEEEIRSKIKFDVEKKNVEPRFLGKISQERVFYELKTNHIFCTPSSQEALGVANIEALAQKIPVVYTNVGGIPEVMDYGNNGFVCEPDNPESIALAIDKCILEQEIRKQKKENGYSYIINNFSKDIMLKRFENICQDCICN
ncbi:MAG: glycosyltransferase family 4 protein [Ginsengibacter sp.]